MATASEVPGAANVLILLGKRKVPIKNNIKILLKTKKCKPIFLNLIFIFKKIF